jgi:diguanylate cyclase (GGDEF)-like protein
MFEGTWLCPTPIDRERMLELEERLGRSGNAIHYLFPASCIIAAFWVGPWALLPLIAGPVFAASAALMEKSRKPEWLMLAALATFVTSVGVAVGFTGGAQSPLIFWLIFYMVGVAARFGRTGLAVATTFGMATAVVAIIAADPAHVGDAVPTIASLLCVGFLAGRYTRVLTITEFDHRERALLDPLTGLLNRTALEPRFEELRQWAVQIDDLIALVVLDIDNFKAVNDTHGHDVGDHVLKEVGYRLRGKTRAFELIYRLGGEEFLLVLPGRNLEEAREVAERLRRTLREARPDGVDITASFGVSCANGEDIDFDPLFHEADQALYEAKAAGRDTVFAAGDRRSPTMVA